ncbi:PD-(D/E)XK nuclease family protein [Mollicutes bacterium LVI A0039]|nr:PD-(D/E)XK nuclease family protein [Mollicutes bacterium LVI A0039]
MNYLRELIGVNHAQSNSILITTADVKRQVLEYRTNHKIIDNLKIMTEHEFTASFIFESSLERLLYLINNNPWNSEKLRVSIAMQLEKSLYLIDSLNLVDHELFEYMQQVKTAGYPFAAHQLPSNYEIITYLPRVADVLQAALNPHCFVAEGTATTVYQYEYFLDEIESSIEYILNLIDNGVALEKIHFYAPQDYHFAIKQVASIYGVPIKSENKLSLLSHHDGIDCLNQILQGADLDLSAIDAVLVEPILNIVNKYAHFADKHQCLELIEYDFNQAQITIHSQGGVELGDKINSLYTRADFETGHFILLGNYQDGLVNYVQDTDIVDDRYRQQLLSCDTRNHLENSLLFNIINKAQSVRLSYSKRLSASDVDLSNNLSGSLVIQDQVKPISKYSAAADYLRYARASYIKQVFNHETGAYRQLNSHYQLNPKLNGVSAIAREADNLKLSYTSINDFYKCSYKYYLNHVLRIKNGKFDSRKVVIGNIIHHVLENLDKLTTIKASELRAMIDQYIVDNQLAVTIVDSIYFDKVSEFLELVCTYMKQEELQSEFNLINRESNYEMVINAQVSLIGKIDKILSRVEGEDLIVEIYDYKTGSLDVNLDHIEYGLNMQNLIYFLLLKDYYKNEAGEEILYGTYQQQIKPKILYDDQDPLDLMMIKGYSMKKNENIFIRKEKVISQSTVDQLLETVSEKVTSAADNIVNNNFEINPKIIQGKNVSCEYCPYLNICNRTVSDFTFITKEK